MFTALVLHVALALQDPPPTADTIVRVAVREAADIWAPYGLVLARAGACRHADPEAVMLTVDLEGATVAGRSGVVLGAVVFGADGIPEPRITLFVTEVRRLVADTRVLGATEPEWPQTLREHVVGRALGRVLAHEIGHYILRQRHHAQAGLMRPLHRSDELVAPSRSLFRLSAAEAAQILEVTAGLRTVEEKKGPTHTAGPGGEAPPRLRPQDVRSMS